MRTLLRGIGYIAMVFVGLCLLFVAINWSDEPLRPEVQAALEWKVPEHAFDDNGYLIMLGMNAPAGEDAGAVGKQLLEVDLANYRAYLQSKETLSSQEMPNAIVFTDSLCSINKERNCVEFYLAQDPKKQAALLREYRYLSERFRAIRQSKHYVEIWPPFPDHDIPRYANLMNAAKLEHIQAISEISHGNAKTGIGRIVENAQFSRQLIKESNTLIMHMIALAMVKNDMRILSELLIKFPEYLLRYREQLAPLVTPLSTPEYSLDRAFQGERHINLPRFYQDVLNNSKQTSSDALISKNGVLNQLSKTGFQFNATTNLNYDFWEVRLKLATSDASNLDGALANAEQEKGRLLGWGYGHFLYPRNPAGKILMQIADTPYKDYIFKHHDTDGYVRLVGLQLQLIAEHVPAARIPEALEKSGPEFRNPYTLQPMEWDAASSELRFQGRQDSGKNPNKKYLYAVTIPQVTP